MKLKSWLFGVATLCYIPFAFADDVWTAQSVIYGTATAPSLTGLVGFVQKGGPSNPVNITITLSNSANGTHAIHVHDFGDISSSDGSIEGSHFNPLNMSHGCYPSTTRHVGDMLASFNYTSAPLPQTVVIQRDLMDLADTAHSIIGHGVIVHAMFDDCVTPKTGNAGARIGQGVIGIPTVPSTSVQRANSNLTSQPTSAIAVMKPTKTYVLRSVSNSSICYQDGNITVTDCNDRKSLVFWTSSNPTVLTGVVSSSNLTVTWLPVSGNNAKGQLQLRSNSSSCVSVSTGTSTIDLSNACNTTDAFTWILDSSPLASLTGIVQFQTQNDGRVRVVANFSGLLPSASGYSVALHVHQYGDEYTNAYNAAGAGGHYNPYNATHALPPTTPRHMGDMGFWSVDASGNLYDDRTFDLLTLINAVNQSTGNIIGRGVVLHVWTDDGVTQPTGAAQGRIALGVIGISNHALPPAPTPTPTPTPSPTPSSKPTTTAPPTTTVPPTGTPSSGTPVNGSSVVLKFNSDISVINNATFLNQLKNDVATSLNIPSSRVEIGTITAGSTNVQIIILSDPTQPSFSPEAAMANLKQQYQTPGSPFLNSTSATQGALDTTVTFNSSPVTVYICSDGTYQSTCPTPMPPPSSTSTDNTKDIYIGAITGGGALILLIIALYCCMRQKTQRKAMFVFCWNRQNEHDGRQEPKVQL